MLNILKQSVFSFMLVLKKSALPVLFLWLCLIANIYFFLPDMNALQNGLDLLGALKIIAFIIFYVFAYVLGLLIVGYEHLNHSSLGCIHYCQTGFISLLTDLIKAYNQILILSLLIIPGLYRYVRLIFVPFISMEQSAVKNNRGKEFSSLKQSAKLTKNVKLFVILMIIYLVFLPLDLLSAFIPNSSFKNTIVLSLLSLSPLYYHCLILSIYKDVKNNINLLK